MTMRYHVIMSHSHWLWLHNQVLYNIDSTHLNTSCPSRLPVPTLILKQPHVPHVIINTYWFPMWLHGSSHVSPWGQRPRESCLFCLHSVLNQCVAIQVIASVFPPSLFPIWCSIGDIILQLSSQRVAVSGDVSLSTGQWAVEAALHLYCECTQGLWVLKTAVCTCVLDLYINSV